MPSGRWTWHSPDGTHHNQIDYISVKKRFRSGIKTARTRTFPGADFGSNHDMVMMTFQTRLKNSRKPTQPRIRFDLAKLFEPTVMRAFQATIGGRFAPLAMLVDEDADLDSMVTHFNISVKKRFRSGIKTARTRTFPGADFGSNHDMVMMTFQTRLKNSRKPTQPRIRFDLAKLFEPTVMRAFQATIGGRFAPLAMLVDEDADLDSMVTHFNKAVTDTTAELLGKQRWKRKLWVTPE